MSRILIVSQPEYGHLLPFVSVGEQLRSDGHDVFFLCTHSTKWLLDKYNFKSELWTEGGDGSCGQCSTCSGMSFWYHFTRSSGGTKLEAIRRRLEVVSARCNPEFFLVDSLFMLSFGLSSDNSPFFGRVALIGTSLPKWNDLPHRITSPLLYLCPKEFEVPQYILQHPLVRYCEPSCGPPYALTTNAANIITDDREIVIVSFGTQTSFQRSFIARLRAINDVAVVHKDITFIVGLNFKCVDAFRASGSREAENCVFIEQIPQQPLLARALALITHGGLSSIKEAILAGIPMIVTPEVFDQPFNAMRVVYHRLGSALFPDEVNGSALETALRRILDKPGACKGITKFQSIFANANANPQVAQLVRDYSHTAHKNLRIK